jgi:hypothetical protein
MNPHRTNALRSLVALSSAASSRKREFPGIQVDYQVVFFLKKRESFHPTTNLISKIIIGTDLTSDPFGHCLYTYHRGERSK